MRKLMDRRFYSARQVLGTVRKALGAGIISYPELVRVIGPAFAYGAGKLVEKSRKKRRRKADKARSIVHSRVRV
jgi:hypothetical protein